METIVAIFFGALGAIVGSFVGVLSERVSTGQSWVNSRSKCNSCNRVLEPKDLVPVLSWLVARGRCFTCGSRVPSTYVLLELSLGALFALSYLTLGLTLSTLVLLLALCVLAFIVMYDLRHTIVPVEASTTLVILAFIFAILESVSLSYLGLTLIIAGAIGLLFVALHVFSGGRAMGLGDAPVALALALISAPNALSGLLFSFWIGALYGIAILLLRRGGPRMGIEVPFVPFLALGFLLAYFTLWNPLLF
jgi:prepilin signal peptidase PulO-like enzyme (type II secretory pathway)